MCYFSTLRKQFECHFVSLLILDNGCPWSADGLRIHVVEGLFSLINAIQICVIIKIERNLSEWFLCIFRYFYDKALYEKSPVMKSYIDSLFLSGAIIYDTLRLSPYLREDDYIVTVFGFPKTESKQCAKVHNFS